MTRMRGRDMGFESIEGILSRYETRPEGEGNTASGCRSPSTVGATPSTRRGDGGTQGLAANIYSRKYNLSTKSVLAELQSPSA